MTTVDLGREPPLGLAQAPQDQLPDRHFLNLRWLACTCLTGLAGGALIAGALFIAVDRQAQFAETPHLPGARLQSELGAGSTFGTGKGDRLVVLPRRVASRQVIQETSVRTVDGKEFVKVKPYIRVTGNLALQRGDAAEDAPTFDPVKIYADVGAFSADTPAADKAQSEATTDENFSVTQTELADAAAGFDVADLLSPEEVTETVRETAAFVSDGGSYAVPMIFPVGGGDWGAGPDLRQAAASELTSGFQANVTTIAKQASPLSDEATEEMSVTLNAGDTLRSVLVAHGATEQEADEILSALARGRSVPDVKPGEEVRLTIAEAGDSERHRPVRVTLPSDGGGTPMTVALAANGFQRMAAAIAPATLRPSQAASNRQGPRANVYDALYETGSELEVPKTMVAELVRIFAFDVDFQRTTSAGDTLEIFYTDTDEEGEVGTPEVLYAAISTRGETHRFYRFRTPDDGEIDYYDPTGKSARKFLVRKPAPNAVFTSGYGMRRHPILGYSRMHTGVDWAARIGTPIMAAGAGRIVHAGWSSGYGKRVEIQHANGYLTTYNHMSAVLVNEGQYVHQGQLVGKVGSTGGSTGPHLHYEVKVNGRFVDPMRIRLPRGRVLDGRILASFDKEKARIDALMNRAPASTKVAAASGS